MKAFLLLALLAALSVAAAAAATRAGYTVRVSRLLTGPILTEETSDDEYNFNAAYIPLVGGFDNGVPIDCLAVRTQQVDGQFLPSKIKIFCEKGYKSPFARGAYTVLEPSQSKWQADGAEDPRVALLPDNNTLLMFYTAVNAINCSAGAERAMLALASCTLNTDPECRNWTLHGPLFPNTFWSKSGALLVQPQPPHYLFWGDSNICIATTADFFTYTQTSECLIKVRPDSFDSALVESGPPPMRLDDGNFIFLYNSARNADIPNPKQGWTLQYNLGFVILNGSSSTQVLQRADAPIMSPQLSWETCDDSDYTPGATPDVVFVNGAKKVEGAVNTWIIYYQGCDTRMGIALLTVS